MYRRTGTAAVDASRSRPYEIDRLQLWRVDGLTRLSVTSVAAMISGWFPTGGVVRPVAGTSWFSRTTRLIQASSGSSGRSSIRAAAGDGSTLGVLSYVLIAHGCGRERRWPASCNPHTRRDGVGHPSDVWPYPSGLSDRLRCSALRPKSFSTWTGRAVHVVEAGRDADCWIAGFLVRGSGRRRRRAHPLAPCTRRG